MSHPAAFISQAVHGRGRDITKAPRNHYTRSGGDEDEISRENNCGRQSLFCQIAFILNSGPLHCDSFMCFLLTVQPHATVPQRRKARETDSLHDCDRQRWDVIDVTTVIYVQVKFKWLQLAHYTPATPDQQHWPVRGTIRGGGWRWGWGEATGALIKQYVVQRQQSVHADPMYNDVRPYASDTLKILQFTWAKNRELLQLNFAFIKIDTNDF